MIIQFYSPNRSFGFLSNFSSHPVMDAGIVWPTAEHLYQALKYPADKSRQALIFKAQTPGLAKKIAWQNTCTIRKDWDDAKVSVMEMVLRLKFEQYPDLMKKLVLTRGKTLVEHTRRDSFWGDGADGQGQNMLGKLLMKIRDKPFLS